MLYYNYKNKKECYIMNRIKIEGVFKHGLYEIKRVYDNFGNWNYTMFYKGKFRKQSYNFEYLCDIALNDENWKLN